MVNFSFNYYAFFIVIFFASTSSFSEGYAIEETTSQLILKTDRTESNLGRPIRAEIYGVSLKTQLNEINLSDLKKDFGLVIDSYSSITDERWPKQSVQLLRLKLYPRQTGKVIIPRLTLQKIATEEKIIHVVQGDTGIPQLSFSSDNPYERQQIMVHLQLTSPDSTSRLSVEESASIAGFNSHPLSFKRQRQKDGSYLLNIGWALTPLKTGMLNVDLPAVTYSVSGVSRKQFYFPLIKMKSKKLPQYLPPTIPVGKVELHSELNDALFLKKGALAYWTIQLSGRFNNAHSLPPVLRQIKSGTDVQILPVNSTRTTDVRNELLISSVTHSIPFKALNTGLLTLPEIRVQYFDPDENKIKTIIHKVESIVVLGLFIRSVLLMFLALLILWVMKLSYQKWEKLKYSRRMRKQAIALLEKTGDVSEIKKAIRLLSRAEYWPVNLTLTQWGRLWSNKYRTDVHFAMLMTELSSAFYSSNFEYNLNKLREKLQHQVIKRKNQ